MYTNSVIRVNNSKQILRLYLFTQHSLEMALCLSKQPINDRSRETTMRITSAYTEKRKQTVRLRSLVHINLLHLLLFPSGVTTILFWLFRYYYALSLYFHATCRWVFSYQKMNTEYLTCTTIFRSMLRKQRPDRRYARVFTGKNRKTLLHPVSTGSGTHNGCFLWITSSAARSCPAVWADGPT